MCGGSSGPMGEPAMPRANVVNSGMKRILFGEFYRDDRIFSVAERLGVALVDLSTVLSALLRPPEAPRG